MSKYAILAHTFLFSYMQLVFFAGVPSLPGIVLRGPDTIIDPIYKKIDGDLQLDSMIYWQTWAYQMYAHVSQYIIEFISKGYLKKYVCFQIKNVSVDNRLDSIWRCHVMYF